MKWVGICGILLSLGLPACAQSIVLTPGGLAYRGVIGGSNLLSQTVVVSSSSGTGNWSATITYVDPNRASGWLSVSQLSGSVSPTSPVTLTFRVNIANLPLVSTHAIVEVNPGQQQVHTFLDVVPAPTGAPTIGQNGVVNGASFSTDAVVSPGSIAALFGVNLSTATEAAAVKPLPAVLSRTQVVVNGAAVPLYFVSPGQINFQMPMDLPSSAVPAYVISNSVPGPTAQIRVAPETPGIFSAQPGGTGQGAVLNQDFSVNGEANPAVAGSVIQVFSTGLGVTNPPLAAGQPGATAEPLNRTVALPTALIDGSPAPVQFSAVAPGFVGLYQVNVQVPASTRSNSTATLQIQVNGSTSNTVTFAVRQ